MSSHNLVLTALKNTENELLEQLSQVREMIKFAIANSNKSTAGNISTELLVKNAQPKGNANKPEKHVKRKYNSANRGRGVSAIQPIIDILKKSDRFLHKVEIESILGNGTNVSSVLSIAKTKGTSGIVNYRPGLSNNQIVWGFSDWLGEDGKPKPQHMYDEEFVMSRK